MSEPGYWHRHPAGVDSTTAVIFDLDGVIADAEHRQHFLHMDAPDWDGFYDSAARDPVLEHGRALVNAISREHLVVVLTGRIEAVSVMSRAWLDDHGVRWDVFISRPEDDDDTRHVLDYKREELIRLGSLGYRVDVAIDDNRKIVAMYREMGTPAVYVHSGYYENTSRYDGGV